MELQHVAGQAILAGALARRAHAHQRLVAQALDLFLRHGLHHVAEGQQGTRAREQQVAAHQVGQAEVRVLGDERLDALQRHVELVRLDRLEYSRQAIFWSRRADIHASSGDEQQEKEGAPHQFADFSSRICQRLSAFTITSVLALEALRTSER